MTTEAPPQIPTPDLSITNGGNYVDLDPTQDIPTQSAPEPTSAPAAESTPQTNGTYKTAIVNCKVRAPVSESYAPLSSALPERQLTLGA